MCEETPLLPKPTLCMQMSAPMKDSFIARSCGFIIVLVAVLAGLLWIFGGAGSSRLRGIAEWQHSEQGVNSCLGVVEQIFVVNMERCATRRAKMRDMLQVSNATSPLACVPVRWGVGTVDGARTSLNEMGRLLGTRQVQDWPQGNPYKPGKHMSHGEYACAVSHYRVYEKIVAMNLPAALILEDDFGFNDNDLPSFTSELQTAVANLNAARGPHGWDILYVDYVDIGTSSINSVPIGNANSGLQHGGCYGYTSAYVLSQTGARKLMRFKAHYANHLIPIDDFLMTLGGNNCPQRYDHAAKTAATALNIAPYKGLNVFSTAPRLSRQTNYLGHLTADDVLGQSC